METNLDEIEINILNKCTLENTHEFCFTGIMALFLPRMQSFTY